MILRNVPLRKTVAISLMGVVATTFIGLVIAQTAIGDAHIFFTFGLGGLNGFIATRVYRHFKSEEEACLLSQQPTSGTSQNPNPSPSPYLTGIASLSLAVSPNASQPDPSPSKFQPEKRLTPVVGFRAWQVAATHKIGVGPSWTMLSLNHGMGLARGRNEARCMATGTYAFSGFSYSQYASSPPIHLSPSAECQCGFYVMNDLDRVPFNPPGVMMSNGPGNPLVVGAVVGWGRVVQHAEEGWRAQYIQVIALLDCKISDDHLRITREVAASYGVPVVGRTALELLAHEYGDSLGNIKSHSLGSGE